MVNAKILISCLALGICACVGMLFMTMLNSPYGLTSIEHTNVEYQNRETQISTNVVVSGVFTSPNNYLGIIYLPFTISEKLQEIPLRFLLSEEETGKILHSHGYVAKNFSDEPFFPIGIPLIQNSKNIKYRFEIVTQDERIKVPRLSMDESKMISTIHLFDRRSLRRGNIWGFLKDKVTSSMVSVGLRVFLLILAGSFLFPFFIQTLVNTRLIRAFGEKVTLLLWLVQGLTIAVILLIAKQVNDIFYLLWIILYLAIAHRLKLKPKDHYYWALSTIVMCPIFLTFSDQLRAEKAAMLTFYFLLFGLVQEFYVEIKRNLKHKKYDQIESI